MPLPVKLYLVPEGPARATFLSGQITPYPTISLVGTYAPWLGINYEEALRGLKVDCFLVDVPRPDAAYLNLVRFHQSRFPGSSTLFICHFHDGGFEERAVAAGVETVLREPLDVDQLADRILARHTSQVEAVRKEEEKRLTTTRGFMTAILSAKDGEGKTSLAVNLATQLALGMGFKVILLDLNTNYDDFTVLLNHRSNRHFLELMRAMQTGGKYADLERDFADFLGKGFLRYICGPCSIRPVGMDEKQVRQFIDLLRANCDYLIVDTPVLLTEALAASLSMADNLLMVVQNHVSSLRNCRAYLAALARHDYPVDQFQIVLNRISPSVGLSPEELQKFLGSNPVVGQLVSSGQVVIEALNSGVPFVITSPQSEISIGVRDVARHLVEERLKRGQSPGE